MLADDAIDAAQVQRLAIAPAEAADLLAETGDVAEQAERGVVEFLPSSVNWKPPLPRRHRE